MRAAAAAAAHGEPLAVTLWESKATLPQALRERVDCGSGLLTRTAARVPPLLPGGDVKDGNDTASATASEAQSHIVGRTDRHLGARDGTTQ